MSASIQSSPCMHNLPRYWHPHHHGICISIDELTWTQQYQLNSMVYIRVYHCVVYLIGLLLLFSCSFMSDSLWPHGLQPTKHLCPWGFSRQEYGMGCHAFLQGIFPAQGSNPGLLHCRQILYHLSHQGNPRILEWVAYPFSRGSSLLRNWTRIPWNAGRFFTTRVTREAHW